MKQIPEPDENNAWRLESPGDLGSQRSPRPDAEDKYFMVSTDGHVQEPADLWLTRMDEQYRERLPGVAIDKQGDKFQKTEGFRPLRIRNIKFEGEDGLRNGSGTTPEARIEDLTMDGVDAEIMFPNKGLTIWATPDAQFSHAMCRAYNDWAWEEFAAYNDRLAPMAAIAPLASPVSPEKLVPVASFLANRSAPGMLVDIVTPSPTGTSCFSWFPT